MRILIASMFALLATASVGCAAKQAPVLSASDAPSQEEWITHDEFEMTIGADARGAKATARSEGDEGNASSLHPQLATTKQKNESP